MFDLLKKKISNFIGGFIKKEEEKPATKAEETFVEKKEPAETKTEEIKEKTHEPKTEIKPEKKVGKKPETKKEITKPAVQKEIKKEKTPERKPEREIEETKKVSKKPEVKKEHAKEAEKPAIERIAEPKPMAKEEINASVIEPIKEMPVEKIDRSPEPKPIIEEKKREVKVGIFGQIKSIFTGEVEIAANDVEPLLQALELDMLEADVGLDVAGEIKNELETKMIGKKIKKGELDAFVKNAIRDTLIEITKNEKAFDLLERMKQTEKPVKIMFIGPNGSGKTTTISKVAKMLMDNGFKVVFGAADTFRAAAVEQIDIHGSRLGVKTIKRDYGSDPTAVAYDAMNYAKAHGIDAVLIDTAGRQETNLNLINELKKMNRVIQPQLKIYIGESIAGTAIVEQVATFNKEIGIDGIILTKLDCDPKGGTILSLSKITGIPIIYIGTGQRYEDIERFDAEKMIDVILS